MSKAKQPIKQRNFVAKHNKHRAVVMRDHTKYTRKDKHKGERDVLVCSWVRSFYVS